MAIDFSARALAAAETTRNRRLRTLEALRRSIDLAGLHLPRLAATLPTIGTPTPASALTGGALVAALAKPEKFHLTGGEWSVAGPNYPKNNAISPITVHQGNGTDPLANATQGQGQHVRFTCWAPKLELQIIYGDVQGGFRLKVDGEYVATGALANAADGTNTGALRFIPITWGDGTAAYRAERHYELEFLSNGCFGGVIVPPGYGVQPWIPGIGLRMLVHGDSMVSNVNDAAPHAQALLPAQGALLSALLGVPDCWVSGVGGTGWVNDNGGNKSTFNARLPIDILPHRPDVIVEIGGKNDAGYAPQQTVHDLVTAWLDSVLANNPDTIIFMTGPIMSRGTFENTAPANLAVRDAKRDAAARYPANVAFIDNLAEEWASGTGNQVAPQGDGNADWCIGPDNAHFTIEGHAICASQIARSVAAAIPHLVTAQ